VIILDENVIDGQRLLLEAWHISVRQIGFDAGRKGLKDDALIVFLRRLRQPTFVTRDLDFYAPELGHQRYAIVVAAVRPVRGWRIRPPLASARSFRHIRKALRTNHPDGADRHRLVAAASTTGKVCEMD
jgi:hypothetical protein